MSDLPSAPAWLSRPDAPRQFVATACTDDDPGAVRAALEAEFAGLPCAEIHYPGDGICNLEVDCDAARAWASLRRLRERLSSADVYLQPRDELGKRLLICDMDMTIVDAETLDEVAAMLGLGEKIAAITRRAMHGEIDFRGALRERIAMLAGQPEQVFFDINAHLNFNRGAERLLAGAKAAGVRTILVSGGFSQVAEEVIASRSTTASLPAECRSRSSTPISSVVCCSSARRRMACRSRPAAQSATAPTICRCSPPPASASPFAASRSCVTRPRAVSITPASIARFISWAWKRARVRTVRRCG